MSPTREEQDPTGFLGRWWVYQRERFPVLAHGPLILAFSSSAVCFSALLLGERSFPVLPAFVVAFVTSLLFFLQLRIADEFKDIDEDTEFRPYRPVPRGLISLKELGVLFILAAAVQLALALWLHPPLVWVLGLAWLYLALMSKEFFVRDWITARPITYLWTHMLIMPLVDLYATACHWSPAGEKPVVGLLWFLLVSFFNGIVIEMGRKIRSEDQEEDGVKTYTRLWGRARASWIWFGFVAATAVAAGYALTLIDFEIAIIGLAALVLIALALTVGFTRDPSGRLAKKFELFSGLWTLSMYLLLGLVPMIYFVTA